ncbi:MAG: hypothetical protein JRN15_16925 [Nitrososphaerota archaeon]|nr:hypothetical protein [Nitrososphaerota archaeon]
MKEYSIHGPFVIRRQPNGHIDRRPTAINEFWETVSEAVKDLPTACGCYLFAVRAAKGIRPWYVGLAEKQTFEEECFTLHKREIYNEVLVNRKGTPFLFFLAKRTNTGRFANPGRNGSRTSRFLETLLIGAALEKNAELMNVHKTNSLCEISVPFLVNSPRSRPSRAESVFRLAIE